MTHDTQRTLDVMTGALLAELGDEVELIFRYGSQIKGNTHPYSDVDLSYVPVHETTWKCITVLVEDRLFDLFPLHWSRLERWADFDDVRGTVLLNGQIIYQRSAEAAARFAALRAHLVALQQPAARPAMLRKALERFQTTGYTYYLLCQLAAQGHTLAAQQQAHTILKTVLHTLAMVNQTPTDTRKLAQVLALPKLPENLANLVERLLHAHTPELLLAACEKLLDATRALLLDEQRQLGRGASAFPVVFESAYPEFRADIQHVLLACERQDMFMLKDSLLSIYHELMVHMAQAYTGVEYGGFNSLADYEQKLSAHGFPELWPYVAREDYAGLRQAVGQFDRQLRAFLAQQGVALCSFANSDELAHALGS